MDGLTDGWCICGFPEEDPLERAWHKLWAWNTMVFTEASERRRLAFEAELADYNRRKGRKPDDLQGVLW